MSALSKIKEGKSTYAIQRKRLEIFEILHNGRQHQPGVKHYRRNVRILKRDELVDPIKGEFLEDVAAASGEHEVGN